ncbi:MAG: ABC transporter permease [Verrucomicrobia bacterium]|nr:ABC transporter permease [Verrucomicrobiota bacterium]
MHVSRAVFRRELRSVVINRYFQVFSALALLGGVAALLFAEDANATGFFILQVALYFVSLFSLLAGVSSAQGEREEWPLLLSQPLRRRTFVICKFFALFSIFGSVLLLLFVPAFFAGATLASLALLFSQTLLLAAAFVALGLACGFLARDRAQALITAVSAWLLMLVGIDLVALFAARWPVLQRVPEIWTACLMLNPLDAFRIEALFALQQIPAEAAGTTPLAAWWIAHAALWFGFIALVWAGALTHFASARLKQWEG